jgi:hypothetical protein
MKMLRVGGRRGGSAHRTGMSTELGTSVAADRRRVSGVSVATVSPPLSGDGQRPPSSGGRHLPRCGGPPSSGGGLRPRSDVRWHLPRGSSSERHALVTMAGSWRAGGRW